MLAIYIFLLVFLLILFILFTAIGFTFKLKVLSLEEKKEFGGVFTVKWLLFSHTFLVGETGTKVNLSEGPKEEKKERGVKEKQSETGIEGTQKSTEDIIETQGKIEVEKRKEIEEKKQEEKRIQVSENKEKTIEVSENKEKTGIIAKIQGKKKIRTEGEEKAKKGMTTREKLHWGLEAFKSLRKPLFCLFSDLLNGIKIKRLESYVTFGLSDPADTGILCGFFHAITGLAYSRCRHCNFSINPVFMNPMLDFQGNAEIRVKIYSMIFPVIKFIFNRKTVSFTYSIIKEKLRGKWKFDS